jgi:CarD family transcriptional regulator
MPGPVPANRGTSDETDLFRTVFRRPSWIRGGTPVGWRVSGVRAGSSYGRETESPMTKKSDFKTGDFVVYPTHGVGLIKGTETQIVAGTELDLLVIDFEQDRMTLRIPVGKARTSGLRRLSSRKQMDVALQKLKGRAKVRRTMWSRRAQEYEAKINSGDPVSIAEVVRDLRRSSNQADQSYSERQMYQAALDRLAREFAKIEQIDETAAVDRLEKLMDAA